MKKLTRRLKEHRPINRIQAECGKCGKGFYDSYEEPGAGPSMTAAVIEMKAEDHRTLTGHHDLQVSLDKTASVKEIDATITVNS
jgi:hypothetical protein